MKTITEKDFFERFIEISQELTYAELRMLYLLITEPYIIELPQQKFADSVQAHRRTINIGLKKLIRLQYIDNDKVNKDPQIVSDEKENGDNVILKHEEASATKVVINSFLDYYTTNNKDFIINEDFYSFILGDIRLPSNFRYNKTFVTQIIRDKYPEVRFYFDLNKSSYKDYSHYYIIRLINSEISRFRKDKFYSIKINNLLQRINDNFSIEAEEVLKIIKSEFPKVRITEKGISLRQPWKGKKSYR